jgi:subtilisin family serine protease
VSDDDNGKFGYKLMATFASIAGAYAARKALQIVWKTSTGKQPPANPEHPEVTWAEAVSWAVVSGAVIGVARMAAQRKVAASWHRSTGKLPPGLEETAA